MYVCVQSVYVCMGVHVSRALGKRAGIVRFGSALCPLDEALSRCVVDISSRPHAEIHLGLKRSVSSSPAHQGSNPVCREAKTQDSNAGTDLSLHHFSSSLAYQGSNPSKLRPEARRTATKSNPATLFVHPSLAPKPRLNGAVERWA